MNYITNWTKEQFTEHIQKYCKIDFNVTEIKSAGEGNMNFTLRLRTTDGRSLVVKQAPPFCAKFPSIPAPEKRLESEVLFFELCERSTELSKVVPKVLGIDSHQNMFYMTDLGEGIDFENSYRGESITNNEMHDLTGHLNKIHTLQVENKVLVNSQMRALNHQYIFNLPFSLNDDIDLEKTTPGLQALAKQIQLDKELSKEAKKIGEFYLKDSATLLHGDFYPRSWLKTVNGIFIIDSEFAFQGFAEFDLGVFLAHMLMSKNFTLAQSFLKKNYLNYHAIDFKLLTGFIATEIIRRVIYVSQLPIDNSLTFKSELLQISSMALKSLDFTKFEDL